MSLKVLHVAPGLDPRAGGVVAAVNGLARAMHETGIQVEIFAPFRKDQDNSLVQELSSAGITITQVGPVATPLGWHAKLKQVAADAISRADIVHIHGVWEEVQHRAARVCQAINKPYVVSPHGMLDPWSLEQSAARKKLFRKWRVDYNLDHASRIHCCSKIEGELIQPLGYTPPQIVEPNGLDLSEFYPLPEPGRFRARYPDIADKRIILFLSRLHYKKGLNLLIPAFAQAGFDDAVLVLAGPCDDAYRAKLDQMVVDSQIDPKRVLFAGMQHGQERIEAFVDAELFVLPSYQENFGIVVAESLAAGTPVLISDKVNIWPDIKEAGVGQVCTTEIPSLIETMKDMIEKRNRPDSQRCQSMAQDRYDWREIAKRWATHLEALV